MASKKHRKKLKRIHLRKNTDIAGIAFIKAMEILAESAAESEKFFRKFTSQMEALKTDEIKDYITCESCTKQCFDIESMESDDDSNWFCPDCWEELEPVMRREYAELKAKGEI